MRHGLFVCVTCRTCANEMLITAADLATTYGYGRHARSLRFRCKKCGEAWPQTTVLELDAHQQKGTAVWVPKRLV